MQPSQYREPPPYPGHTKQLYQTGTRKSFSGSETSTDVSLSSLENLSTSLRQEPQGEENTQQQQHGFSPNLDPTDPETGYSILARLGMPPNLVGKPGQEYMQVPVATTCSESHPQWSHPGTHVNVTTTLKLNRSLYHNQEGMCNPVTYSHPLWAQGAEASHQSMASQGMSYYTHLPPPPEYPAMPVMRPMGNPSMDSKDLTRSHELLEKSELHCSRSQLDFGRYVTMQTTLPSRPEHAYYSAGDINLRLGATQDYGKMSKLDEWDHSAIATRASQMVEMLSEENKQLRDELNLYEKKVSKLQKFELEIQCVHESYESLVNSSKKRERLEMALKGKMGEEIKKLKVENKHIREQLENALAGGEREWSHLEDNDLKREVARREARLIEALAMNKDLSSSNDRLDMELKSHQSCLQEHQSHISILDNALTTAQSNVVRLEDECRKKQLYMERVDQLQKALAALQSTCEKREAMEKQLRMKLEKELEVLKPDQSRRSGDQTEERPGDIIGLKRLCNEKEARILHLEGEIIKYEQRFLEESVKKLSLEGETKDAKLVALSHSSKETEKLIEEAKAEKLKYMEELYQANRNVTELEAQVKSLETQLSEKEAMIKVLQRSSMTRSSSVHSIYCSPLHSPRPSLVSHMSGSLSRPSSQGSAQTEPSFFREYGTTKHIKTSTCSASSVDIHRLADTESREARAQEKAGRKSADDTEIATLWHV